MTLPTHVFSPGNIGLPYAQEISKYMTPQGLLIHEHDIEMGYETYRRFQRYVEKKPERIHTAPYLIRAIDGKHLVWVHRQLNTRRLDKLSPRARERIINYLPAKPKPVKVIISITSWVQGGEPETDYFPLGFTWMPRKIWDLVFQRVAQIDWTMLDTRISQECFGLGEKALVHWDCVASHANITGHPEIKT